MGWLTLRRTTADTIVLRHRATHERIRIRVPRKPGAAPRFGGDSYRISIEAGDDWLIDGGPEAFKLAEEGRR